MAAVFYFPLPGTPTAPGNQLSFFVAGLDQPLDVWTDPDLTSPWSQPIIFNAAGNSDGPIYVSSTPDMKVVYEDENGVAIPGYPVDFVTPSTIPGVMTTQITVLTNAQIKTLPTTPITVVTAPASSDARVKVFAVSYELDTVAGAYTNINTTYADFSLVCNGNALVYGPVNDSTVTPALTQLTDWLGAAAAKTYEPVVPVLGSTPATGAVGYVLSTGFLTTGNLGGQAVALEMQNNGSGALTGGNAANTLTVTVYFAYETV